MKLSETIVAPNRIGGWEVQQPVQNMTSLSNVNVQLREIKIWNGKQFLVWVANPALATETVKMLQ